MRGGAAEVPKKLADREDNLDDIIFDLHRLLFRSPTSVHAACSMVALQMPRLLMGLGLSLSGPPVVHRASVPRCAMPCEPFGRDSIVAAIEVLKQGGMIVVTDDEGRENEGDLIMAGEHANAINAGFIIRYSSGVICIAVPDERLQELQLPPMCVNNEDPKGTAFTVSVDYIPGSTTGISGGDRAATFRALADPNTRPEDFQRPGHVFPLRPKAGGVRERDGHTEAAIDFMKVAGLKPAGILAEVCNDDGTMARIPDLIPFCEEHGLVLTSIADLSTRPPHTQCPPRRFRLAQFIRGTAPHTDRSACSCAFAVEYINESEVGVDNSSAVPAVV